MKKILVPTDFSANSLKAVKFALDIAASKGSKVLIIHQTSIMEVSPDAAFTGLYIPAPENQMNFLEKELQKFVKKAVKSFGKTLTSAQVDSMLVTGVGTVDLILDTVKKQKCDAIIMGSTGASGLKKLFMGSVAASIIGKSDVPVIVIPDSFRRKSIKKIGYASDLSNTLNELKLVAPVVKALDAELEIFHIEPTFPTSTDYLAFKPETDIPMFAKKSGIEKLSYRLIKTKLDNDFFTGVSKYKRVAKPDIIFNVTHSRSWVSRLLNPSKTKGLAYHNEMPVVSIKAN